MSELGSLGSSILWIVLLFSSNSLLSSPSEGVRSQVHKRLSQDFVTHAHLIDKLIRENVQENKERDVILSFPEVNSTSGLLKGATLVDCHAFYSIPYAEEPQRYMSPEPVHYRGTIDVSTPDYVVCHQGHEVCDEEGKCDRNYQDDCLVLNINVPLTVDFNKTISSEYHLPVMIYIHGGAFTSGSGTSSGSNGQYLSNSTNTIIVTINYRLDALGFLVYEEGNTTFEGNQGIKDQQMALQWVHDNIHKFGGNKEEVTIFGMSAGAQSVMLHLFSETSEPLFKRALMQSNPAIFLYPSPDEAKLVTDKLLKALNCSSDPLNCLRTTSSKDIVNARVKVMAMALAERDIQTTAEPYRPITDGVEFTDQALNLFRDGKWQTYKEVLMGTTTQELADINAIFSDAIIGENLFQDANTFILGEYYGPMIGQRYAHLAQQTSTGRLDYTDAIAQEMSDMFFVCPSRAMARFISHTSSKAYEESPVYLYAMNHAPSGESCEEFLSSRPEKCGYAYHGVDTMFLFQTGPDRGYEFNENDTAVTEMFSNLFGSFAHNGFPSSDPNVWPSYVDKDRGSVAAWSNIRIQAPESIAETDFRKELCDFWDSTGYYLNMTSTAAQTTAPDSAEILTTSTETTGGAKSLMISSVVWLNLMIATNLVLYF